MNQSNEFHLIRGGIILIHLKNMINALIHTAVRVLIGWILIEYVPKWLILKGIINSIIKVIGVLIIISALLNWV